MLVYLFLDLRFYMRRYIRLLRYYHSFYSVGQISYLVARLFVFCSCVFCGFAFGFVSPFFTENFGILEPALFKYLLPSHFNIHRLHFHYQMHGCSFNCLWILAGAYDTSFFLQRCGVILGTYSCVHSADSNSTVVALMVIRMVRVRIEFSTSRLWHNTS